MNDAHVMIADAQSFHENTGGCISSCMVHSPGVVYQSGAGWNCVTTQERQAAKTKEEAVMMIPAILI
jgi:hypothetical protein